jgi:hypothetical protein
MMKLVPVSKVWMVTTCFVNIGIIAKAEATAFALGMI